MALGLREDRQVGRGRAGNNLVALGLLEDRQVGRGEGRE